MGNDINTGMAIFGFKKPKIQKKPIAQNNTGDLPMSYEPRATLFYGTTFTLTELEVFFGLELGADNWEGIDNRLEDLGFQRIFRDCYTDDSDNIIVSVKTIQVFRCEPFMPITPKDLHIDIEAEQKYQNFVSATGLKKEIGWFLCAGDV